MDNQNYNLNTEANYTPDAQGSKKGSIVAMVLGLVSVTLSCIPLFGSIPAIILAIISLVQVKKQRALNIPQTYGFLKGGKISAVLGLIFGIIITVLYVALIALGVAGY